MRGFTVQISDAKPQEARTEVLVEQRAIVAGVDAPANPEAAPASEGVNSENIHCGGQLIDQYRIIRLGGASVRGDDLPSSGL